MIYLVEGVDFCSHVDMYVYVNIHRNIHKSGSLPEKCSRTTNRASSVRMKCLAEE